MKRQLLVRGIASALVLFILSISPAVCAGESAGEQPPFQDEPAAHALYDAMTAAMRAADSLSYESSYSFGASDVTPREVVYRIWLKKPNFARIETFREGKNTGILVGDGEYFWIYWPQGRFQYDWERSGEREKQYKETRLTSYMKKRSPPGAHSLGHEVGKVDPMMGMTILDPSTFHGYTDSLQPYVDGVKGLGTEKVADEECDVIEVSIMEHQRSWRLWLSKRDHLPRKLEQIIRVSQEIRATELWSDVKINAEIASEKFSWSPPEGWREWRVPPIEEGLLKPGTRAPGFTLESVEGGKISLADYRGKIVWLYVWRAG